MELHLVKTATGYAIVERRPGPYSVSPPTDTVVLALTDADIDRFGEAMRPAAEPVAAASKTAAAPAAPAGE
jgi:hypothetical protein